MIGSTNSADLSHNPVLRDALAETGTFLEQNGLRLIKVTPSISGVPLAQFQMGNLNAHRTVHIALTLEVETPSVSDEDEKRSNLVASHLYVSPDSSPHFMPIPAPQPTSSSVDTLLDDYLNRHINAHLEAALTRSKVEFPNYESQLNRIYEVLKHNLTTEFAKDAKSRMDFQAKVSQLIETKLTDTFTKEVQKSVLATLNLPADVSRINHSHFQHKINEIFDENRSKLVADVSADLKSGEKGGPEAERLALSRFLHHYDVLKSRLIGDMEKAVNTNVLESQIRTGMGEDWREYVLQGFLKNMATSKIVEEHNDDEEAFPLQSPLLPKNGDLAASVKLKEELKVYISQLLLQNLQTMH
jgi:hypothetical protein